MPSLMSRKLNFLHYILNEDEDSLIHKFFTAQCRNPVKGDWVMTVKEYLSDLDINMTFEQMKSMSKQSYKNMVKEKVRTASFLLDGV